MPQTSYTVSVILAAGGQGTRMKSSIPKQFLELRAKPVALYSFELLSSLKEVVEFIAVCDPAYRHLFPPSVKFALPGERRQDSIFNAFQLVDPSVDLVCIHDSARPFLTAENLANVLREAHQHKAAALAVPMKFTVKQTDANGFVLRTIDRSTLWEMHTPQVATPELLRKGFEIARAQNIAVTDDMALVELTGHPVKLIQDSYANFKITTPEDWALAERCLNIN